MSTPRPAPCLALLLLPGAVFPAPAWPTAAEVFAKAKPGDWIKYKQFVSQGPQRREGFLWQTYQGPEGGGFAFAQAMLEGKEAPAAPPTAAGSGIQLERQVLPGSQAFQKPPAPPPGMGKVKDEFLKSEAFRGLRCGELEYDGTRYDYGYALTLPNGMAMSYKASLYHSPQAPGSGMVRFVLDAQGPMTAHQELELVTSSAAEAAAAKALEFKTARDVLGYAEALERTRRLDPKASEDEVQHFLVARCLALLALGVVEPVVELRHQIRATTPGLDTVIDRLAEAGVRSGDPRILQRTTSTLETAPIQAKYQARALAAKDDPAARAELGKLLGAAKDKEARARILDEALPVEGRTKEQIAARLALLPDDAERLAWLESRLWKFAGPGADPAALEVLAAAHPPLAASSAFALVLARALAGRGDAAAAKARLEPLLAQVGTEPRAGEALTLLRDLGDPRLAALTRKYAEAALVRWTANLGGKAPDPHAGREMARLAACLGDKARAAGYLKAANLGQLSDFVPVVAALHGPGGKPTEAQAWRDQLALSKEARAAGYGFREPAARAEIDLACAAWERALGRTDAWAVLVGKAIQGAVKANVELVEGNSARPSGKRLFWRTGMVRLHESPYFVILEHLLAVAGPAADARVLELLKALRDEFPASSEVRDAWGEAVRGAGKRADPALYLALLAALPAGFEENWKTAVVSESIRPAAARGDLATVQKALASATVPNHRAEILRAAILALVGTGRTEAAAGLVPALDQAVGAGADRTHKAYATVGLAVAYARDGKPEAALKAYLARETNLREGMVLRRANGRPWTQLVEELGYELGRRMPGPGGAVAWLKAVPHPQETPFLAAGLARGLAAGPPRP